MSVLHNAAESVAEIAVGNEDSMISVVIPACNEANVIGRLLQGLLDGLRPGELEIIVICNGCTDDTAAVARRFGRPVKVLETPIPSKTHALNMGDCVATGFPRFYIDADIIVTLDTIRHLTTVLCKGSVHAASPRMHINLESRSWLIRAYYETWIRLPYCAQGMTGGCYALSRKGRGRFELFPEIISDDGYVRLLFNPGERTTVEECCFEVMPPRRLSDLINVQTRVEFGKHQLYTMYPELRSNDPRSYRETFWSLVKQPRMWPCLFVYSFVKYVTRIRGRYRFRTSGQSSWERDESSRTL